MIYEQDTIPFPVPWHNRPTFKQFRERYGLSYFEIAMQAKLHVRTVYWMEQGYRTEFPLAVRIMNALSSYAGHTSSRPSGSPAKLMKQGCASLRSFY